MALKVLGGIFGALLAISGVFCLITPGVSGMQLAWVIGAVMLIDGISSIFTYSTFKKMGLANGWTLASAILSVICGVFIVFSGTMQLMVDLLFAYFIAAWFILNGVLRIIAAFRVKALKDQLAPQMPYAGAFTTMIVMGILQILIGVLCAISPVVVFATIGVLVGLGALFVGITFVLHAFK